MTTDLDAPANFNSADAREDAMKDDGQVDYPTTKQVTTTSLMRHLLTNS